MLKGLQVRNVLAKLLTPGLRRAPSTTKPAMTIPSITTTTSPKRQGPVVTSAASFRAFASAGDISNVSVNEAHDLASTKDHIYLDVRTTKEFEAGHAPGAVNVPVWVTDAAGQMTPNPGFLSEVEQVLPSKDAAICVGCASGKRSLAAAEIMSNAGYTGCKNVEGGFSAWCAQNLPVTK